MAFTVQDNTGTVAGANSYVALVDFKAYHDDRDNDYSAYSDAQLQTALVRATDYIDGRFRFVGEKRGGRDQNTEWPRTGAWDRDRYYITDIPVEVIEATCEYALRAAAADINPDPDRDSTGRTVQSKYEEVGPIKESTVYTAGAVFEMPRYPTADNRLKRSGLVVTGGRLVRG